MGQDRPSRTIHSQSDMKPLPLIGVFVPFGLPGLIFGGSSTEFVILVILAIAVITVLALNFRSTVKSRRSLERLAHTAGRLSGGDWEARLPIDPYQPSDVLSEVSHAFNRMAGELKSRYDQSRRERDQLETVLANMSDGVLAVDSHGVVRLVNRSFLKYFRSVFELPVGYSYSEAFRNRELQEVIKALLQGVPEDRHEVVLAESSRRVVVLRTALIQEAGGADVRGVVVARDITARQRVDQMRRDFVANVSHELRTPLTVILGYIEALKDVHLPADERDNFLNTISRNAVRMNRIVADLLELSRIEASDYRPQRSPFSLRALVDEVMTSLHAAVQLKHQSLNARLDPAADTFLADRDAVARILTNLIDNARKYTPDNGEIVVLTAGNDAGLTITVADNGIGVPETDRSRLFERFFRVDRARSRESGGTGLGLAIVKHLAESQGGWARYEPNVPKGSRFIVFLPTQDVGDDESKSDS